jgi:Tol biopolymer transport system component
MVLGTAGLSHPWAALADTIPAGDVIFSSDRANNGHLDVWVFHYGTTGTYEKLTTSPFADLDPVYTPGGTGFAFTRYNSSDFDDGEIWYFNGSSTKRLTNNAADDYAPTFSPDGERIAFTSNRDGDYEIFTMAIDGTDVKQLTKNTSEDLDPTWSPDRTKIAFSSDRDGNFDIWTMNRDGTSPTNRTQPASIGGGYFAPDWAPNGAAIAYHHLSFDGNSYWQSLGSVSTTSTFQENLTPTMGYDEYPSFLPNSSMVVYDSDLVDRGGAYVGLYVTPVSTLSPVAITSGSHFDYQPSWQPIPSFPLVDARFSTFKADIEWVFGEGITVGCSPERYCPTSPVTRGQMASFLARAMDLPPTATDYFSDDTGTTHEANINKIAAAAITTGCAPGLYCPDAYVTRAQMASFLARALDLPNTATDYFSDDNGTTHENNINRIAAAGITTGCTATTYCPTANVTRGQMAAFLHRAFGP